MTNKFKFFFKRKNAKRNDLSPAADVTGLTQIKLEVEKRQQQTIKYLESLLQPISKSYRIDNLAQKLQNIKDDDSNLTHEYNAPVLSWISQLRNALRTYGNSLNDCHLAITSKKDLQAALESEKYNRESLIKTINRHPDNLQITTLVSKFKQSLTQFTQNRLKNIWNPTSIIKGQPRQKDGRFSIGNHRNRTVSSK